MRKWSLSIFSVMILLWACAPVISKQSLSQADPTLTFQELQKDPERYKGRVILLGGRILSATVRDGETWIAVLQHPLDWRDKPEDTDVSYGRFLIRFPDFRDPAVYAPGRKVTVVGEVQGKEILPLNGTVYTYPILLPRESYLWKPEDAGPFFQFGIGMGGVFR